MAELKLTLPNSPDPELYHYYEGLKAREVYLNDDIDSFTVDLVGLPLKRMDEEDSTKPIKIYINSPGGSLVDGLIICDIIENLKSPVEIIVLGYAFSMGAIILMAGANKPNIKKKCYPFSIGLIHGGSNSLAGTSSQVKDFYKFQERLEDKVKKFVVERTKFTEEEYDKVHREELFMTAEDMLEKGLVDEIIEQQ